MNLAVDVDLGRIARETAALSAIDLANLVDRAQMASVKRLTELR
jgi:ATP-dependent Zn protease